MLEENYQWLSSEVSYTVHGPDPTQEIILPGPLVAQLITGI